MNPTGIHPTEYKVLIEPKQVEEFYPGTSIRKAAVTEDAEKWSTTEGTLIAASPLAFTYASEKEWVDAGAEPPRPGERILFAKYAGTHIKGKDGKEYVLANDKDVLAVMTD